jgi:hypothetical protein
MMSTIQHCGTSTWFCSRQTKIVTPHSSLLLQLASMKSFWILKCTSKVWESTHACVVKYIRPWLPSQAPRGGLASQTRTCMGTFTADMLHRVWDEFDYYVDVCRVTQGAHIEGLWLTHENLDRCSCWRCRLCPCKVRNKFRVNFWNRTILLCTPCIYVGWYRWSHNPCSVQYGVAELGIDISNPAAIGSYADVFDITNKYGDCAMVKTWCYHKHPRNRDWSSTNTRSDDHNVQYFYFVRTH